MKAPEGTRFPRPSDRGLPFIPKGVLRGRIEWSEFLDYHEPPTGHFTLLVTHGEWVSAAACVEVRRDDLVVDYLARNDLFRPATFVPAGTVLLSAIEANAEALGLGAIRLDCVPDVATRRWYESNGFVTEGPARDEPGWGPLTPMVRRVGPGAGP